MLASLVWAAPGTLFSHVTVTLDVSQSPPRQLSSKLLTTRTIFGKLLGVELPSEMVMRPAQAPAQGKELWKVRYAAPSWPEGLSREDREAQIDILRGLWGAPNVRVEEGAPGPTAPALLLKPREVLAKLFQEPESPFRLRVEGLRDALADPPKGLNFLYDRGAASAGTLAVTDGSLTLQLRPSGPAPQLWTGLRVKPSPDPKALRKPLDAAARRAINEIIEREAQAGGVDPDLVKAIVRVKSGYDSNIGGGGAYGLMLVSPAAAASVGLADADLYDPETNIRAGARILARLFRNKRLVTGDRSTDVTRVLAAYQAGVKAVVDSGGIPQRADVKSFLGDVLKIYQKEAANPLGTVTPPEEPLLSSIGTAVSKAKSWLASLVQKAAPQNFMVTNGSQSLDFHLLMEAMCRVENTSLNPRAVSSEGAMGLCQLMPGTARNLKVQDPFDPQQNVSGAVRHFRRLARDVFPGSPVLAVAAYNAGEGATARYWSKQGTVPPYQETVLYLDRVFAKYHMLGGGEVRYEEYMPETCFRRVKSKKTGNLVTVRLRCRREVPAPSVAPVS